MWPHPHFAGTRCDAQPLYGLAKAVHPVYCSFHKKGPMVQLVKEAAGLTRNGGASRGAAARFVCSGDVLSMLPAARGGAGIWDVFGSHVGKSFSVGAYPCWCRICRNLFRRTLRFGALDFTAEVEVPALALIVSSCCSPSELVFGCWWTSSRSAPKRYNILRRCSWQTFCCCC